jgi:two-component system phosphoglycerate transport system response regulator PgtA
MMQLAAHTPQAFTSRKILLVEDDLSLLEGWKDLFDLLGHSCAPFSRGLAALANRSAILDCELLISDYYLPDLNGVELIKRIRAINPAIRVILLTGSRDRGIAEAVGRIERCQLLHKPINIEDLERAIDQLSRRP